MPAVTMPPGELMYRLMSFSGFSASRKSIWATITLATWSSIPPTRKITRSLSNRE
jgi:hypothetical protein